MEPKDRLTSEFYKSAIAYVKETLKVDMPQPYLPFVYWNKNKRTLFRLLGNKLKVKIPYTLKVDDYMMANEYDQLLWYRAWAWYEFYHCWNSETEAVKNTHNREFSLLFLYMRTRLQVDDFKEFWWLFDTWCILRNHYRGDKYKFKNGLTLHQGEKVNKFIMRFLAKENYPRQEKFERFFLQRVNAIRQKKTIDTNLVISIDPLDFMTMSDNDCNWSSCMSWHNNGCYSAGTIEMMNSNCVMVAYLEPEFKKNYHIDGIDNKMQRFLIICNKDIILTGKVYPGFYNTNTDLQEETLATVMALAKKNLHWTYQYKYQNYYDCLSYYHNNYVKKSKFTEWQHLGKLNKHLVLFYSDMMYNDIIADHDEDYMCCRNYVKKSKKINISGPATCMVCGKRLEDNVNRTAKLCEKHRKVGW